MKDVDRARDEWLTLRCQAKEPGAFDDFVRHMERPLFYFVWKLVRDQELALEILQEVWLRVARTIHSLREPRSVRAWLYRLAHGLAVDHIRRERRRAEAESEHAGTTEGVSASESFDGFDAVDIHRALDRLEAEHREVLILHFLEDFAVREIADIVRCPEGTVKSRLFYARKALKEQLLKGRIHVQHE